MLHPQRGIFNADEFVVSAGCVLLKPLPRDKSITVPRLPDEYSLVFIRNRRGDSVIAKGRKDMDEAAPHTAVRETYEETGYKSTIIALPNPSLTPGAREAVMNKEAIAVTLKVDRMSRPDKKSAQKFVFWYVSEVDTDESGEAVQRVQGTQLDHEDYEVLDAPLDECGLTWEEDRKLVELTKSLLLMRYKVVTGLDPPDTKSHGSGG